MNSIDRFNEIRTKIPDGVKIIAVSKTQPAAIIEELYLKTNHRNFGENKAQELNLKYEVLPKDINWHFIGHLQTNKIKKISPYVGLIQSVDSYRLLKEINSEALNCNRKIKCLLQFHIASEEQKYGFSIDEVNQMIEDDFLGNLTNIAVKGVMGMATNTQNEKQIGAEFKTLYTYYNTLKTGYFSSHPDFSEISMGMTDDYKIAIEEGSTIVRIGSGIFRT